MRGDPRRVERVAIERDVVVADVRAGGDARAEQFAGVDGAQRLVDAGERQAVEVRRDLPAAVADRDLMPAAVGQAAVVARGQIEVGPADDQPALGDLDGEVAVRDHPRARVVGPHPGLHRAVAGRQARGQRRADQVVGAAVVDDAVLHGVVGIVREPAQPAALLHGPRVRRGVAVARGVGDERAAGVAEAPVELGRVVGHRARVGRAVVAHVALDGRHRALAEAVDRPHGQRVVAGGEAGEVEASGRARDRLRAAHHAVLARLEHVVVDVALACRRRAASAATNTRRTRPRRRRR